jgi:hypothetical protein
MVERWSTSLRGLEYLCDRAATWGSGDLAKYPDAAPEWADFERSLQAKFTPLNTVRELVEKWTALRLTPNGGKRSDEFLAEC